MKSCVRRIRSFVRRLKVYWNAAMGRDSIVKPSLACAKERFGSDYGGWDVITELLDSHSVVYSFGVGEDASFDVALIEKFGITIHAFDPTPKSIEWVKQQGFSDSFVMHEYGLAAFDGTASFNPPENPDYVSHTMLKTFSTESKAITVPVKRLGTIMKELGHNHIDILKMDIEGAEYDVIDDISTTNIRPQQLLVEFHHRFPDVGIKKTTRAINTIMSMGYELFSVSDTNEEFCFVRKSSA